MWYLSADDTSATFFVMFEDSDGAKLRAENLLASPLIGPFQDLFEIKSFTVLGPVKKDLYDIVTQFGAGIRKYAGGFYRLYFFIYYSDEDKDALRFRANES